MHIRIGCLVKFSVIPLALFVSDAISATGGWFSGGTPLTAYCENLTTGVASEVPINDTAWLCSGIGVAVSEGDEVLLRQSQVALGPVGSGSSLLPGYYGAVAGEHGAFYIVDFDGESQQVDLTTGDRTPLAAAVGSNDGVALDQDGNLLIQWSGHKVFSIDVTTGVATEILNMDDVVGSFDETFGLAVEDSGDVLFYVWVNKVDFDLARVNLDTLERTWLSGSGLRLYPYALIAGIDVNAHNEIYAATEFKKGNAFNNGVIRIHPITGDRSIVSGAAKGSGPRFSFASKTVDIDDGNLYVLDYAKSIVRVDKDTGDRSLLNNPWLGNGIMFQSPRALTHAPSGDGVMVVTSEPAVYHINTLTGERSRISGEFGPSQWGGARGIAVSEVRCVNEDTAQEVVIPGPLSDRHWDCTQSGLAVTEGDTVTTEVTGVVLVAGP